MYTDEMSAIVYHYDEKALNTLAILFGRGFLHLGTEGWVDALCQESDLAGKRVLDFGSGAGGIACYIAKHYDAQVTGLEFSKPLIEQSLLLAKDEKLNVQVDFAHIENMPLPLPHKYDLILSINTLSHCKDKDLLFTELGRALRSHGTLAVMDWFHKSPHYSEATQSFFKFTDQIFYLNTPQEYLQRLEKNKLNYVNFKDNTKAMRLSCEKLITDLKVEYEGQIVSQFGAEYFEWWVEYWSLLHAALQSGDLLTGHVRGIKA